MLQSNLPLKILWVGTVDRQDGLRIALRAIAAANRKNIEMHICGVGVDDENTEFIEIAEAGGIQGQCYWHGNVDHDKILGMMAEADLLFFTSIMEATSTVVLEAISVGLPVLCFNTCGFGPIVKDFAGITIEVSNPDKAVADFASELLRVYNNREILNNLSKQILSNRQSLTWDSKARKTAEIYKACLNKGL